MGDLGVEIRRLRAAKDVSLEQVAAATKVGVHHLESLEKGDFDGLPSEVFVRGFLRACAGFLGAKPEALVDLYRRDRESSDPGAAAAGEHTVQQMSRILTGASGGGIGRGGLALRIRLDRNLGRLALKSLALAAVVAGLASLAIMMIGRRGESVPREGSAPLRASRRVTEAPPTSPAQVPMLPVPLAETPPPPAPPAPSSTAPASEPEAKLAPALAHARDERLEVPEHGVGSAVEDGRLAGRASAFEEGDAVWFWTRVDGGRSGQAIRHVWLHGDREVHSVDLKVGSAQWRTWSRKTLRAGSAGHWSVEARDSYGRVLASEEFDCRSK